MHDQTSSQKDSPSAPFLTSQYPQVIYEEADHEVVVVNLLEGTYYYLTGTAAFIWMGIHSGLTTQEVIALIQAHTGEDKSSSEEVQAFMHSLIRLSLVAPAYALAANPPSKPNVSDYLADSYVSPEIETYSDLQDILLLDPVHDVDESGWPTPRNA